MTATSRVQPTLVDIRRAATAHSVPARAGARKARTPVAMVAASFATVGNACVLTLPIRLIGEANAFYEARRMYGAPKWSRLDANAQLVMRRKSMGIRAVFELLDAAKVRPEVLP